MLDDSKKALTSYNAIVLSSEHSEYKWCDLKELSETQRIRAIDAFEFNGELKSRVF